MIITDRQIAVLLVLAEHTGKLTTLELTSLLNRSSNDEDRPESVGPLSVEQVFAVAKQLAGKGLVEEDSYLNTMKRWRITDSGRQRTESIRV